MYLMFPIGIMFYFGTNLDERFAVPDFWPKPEQANRVPTDKDEIHAELQRLRARRMYLRDRSSRPRSRPCTRRAMIPLLLLGMWGVVRRGGLVEVEVVSMRRESKEKGYTARMRAHVLFRRETNMLGDMASGSPRHDDSGLYQYLRNGISGVEGMVDTDQGRQKSAEENETYDYSSRN